MPGGLHAETGVNRKRRFGEVGSTENFVIQLDDGTSFDCRILDYETCSRKQFLALQAAHVKLLHQRQLEKGTKLSKNVRPDVQSKPFVSIFDSDEEKRAGKKHKARCVIKHSTKSRFPQPSLSSISEVAEKPQSVRNGKNGSVAQNNYRYSKASLPKQETKSGEEKKFAVGDLVMRRNELHEVIKIDFMLQPHAYEVKRFSDGAIINSEADMLRQYRKQERKGAAYLPESKNQGRRSAPYSRAYDTNRFFVQPNKF